MIDFPRPPMRRYWIPELWLSEKAQREDAIPTRNAQPIIQVVLSSDHVAEVARLEAKHNELADQASKDTQRFIDCTKAVKALVPEATSLEDGIKRLEAQVRELEANNAYLHSIVKQDTVGLQAKLREAEQQLAFVNSERADKLQKIVIEAGLADYARMKARLSEATALIGDTTAAYERYELRLHEATERERRLREVFEDLLAYARLYMPESELNRKDSKYAKAEGALREPADDRKE